MEITPTSTPAIHHRYREDGWTPEVQSNFIHALAACGSVAEACRVVNRSATTAYRLRAKPEARGFREAWTAATAMAYRQALALAMDRMVIGLEEPVYHSGEQIGFRTTHSDRLLCFMLDHLRPERLAVAAHPDRQDYDLACAVNQIEAAHAIETECETALDATDEMYEALDAWGAVIDGVPGRLAEDETWSLEEVPGSLEDVPGPPEEAPEASGATGEPTLREVLAKAMAAMTIEELAAFNRAEDKAYDETVALARSVGIEPGFGPGNAPARASA